MGSIRVVDWSVFIDIVLVVVGPSVVEVVMLFGWIGILKVDAVVMVLLANGLSRRKYFSCGCNSAPPACATTSSDRMAQLSLCMMLTILYRCFCAS